jgi:hypothetical protein
MKALACEVILHFKIVVALIGPRGATFLRLQLPAREMGGGSTRPRVQIAHRQGQTLDMKVP